MMLIVFVTCLIQQTLAYYERSDSTCTGIISSCNLDSSCTALYRSYMNHCQNVLMEVLTDDCENRCKRSLKKLIEHPIYSRFTECECRGNNICVKQKCKLLEACLDMECNEEASLTTTATPYDGVLFTRPSSTPSGHSITMSSSTVSLGKVNCETVILHCKASYECDLLLTRRDEQCAGYRIDGSTPCTKECTETNTKLRENNIGNYMTTCKFETVEIDSSLFSYLINTCVQYTSETESPSYTERGTRPDGDCKRHFNECRGSSVCSQAYHRVMEECKRQNRQNLMVTQCTPACETAVADFRALALGAALWSCNCYHASSSERCVQIKLTFSDICNAEECRDVRQDCDYLADRGLCYNYGVYCKQACNMCSVTPDYTEPTTQQPLSTEVYSVDTTEQTATPGLPGFYRPADYYTVNWTCHEQMRVTIEYSSESGATPYLTAIDKGCKAVDTGAGQVMVLELQYEPGTCGTEIVRQADNIRIRNTIYVRSDVDHSRYSPIADIECLAAPAPQNAGQSGQNEDTDAVKMGSIAMNFYKDQLFSKRFQTYVFPEGVVQLDTEIVDLGELKTVYVELDGGNVSTQTGHHVILDSCYATPNGKPHYSSPHYFLQNGCRMDPTFKVHDFNYGKKARFSFYRMRFADHDPGMVFVHCEVIVCKAGDPDCRISCPMKQETEKFQKYGVSQGPYTFSSGARSTLVSLALLLTLALLTAT